MKLFTHLNIIISSIGFLKSLFTLLFICVTIANSNAQNTIRKDTANFIYYTDKILVKANLSTQTDSYFLKSKDGVNLKLIPNNEYKLFFTVDYKFICFIYGFFPKIFGGANNDNDLKGKSSFSDYNFRLFLGHWLQNFNYSKVRGYYVENTADFLPNWTQGKDPYLQFPNLKNETFGMSTSYVFNPKFSLRSISSFTEWQKQSAGSFIPTFSYEYNRFSFDQDIKSKEDNFNFRLGLSYFYNFIFREKFYIAPNFTPAVGIRFSKDKTTDDGVTSTEKETYFTRFLEGGVKFGYNSEHILFGASLNFNVNWYNSDSRSRIENDKIYGLLYFGYRFDAPKFIAKPIEKAEEKLKM